MKISEQPIDFDSPLYFGGTFDPPHLGHTMMLRMAQSSGFKQIIVLPAGDPIHKQGQSITSFEHRYKMAKMAFGDITGVTLNPIENTLPKPTPLIQTLRALIPDFDTSTNLIPFLLGADSLVNIASWVESKTLVQKLLFVVAGRQDFEIPDAVSIQGKTYPLNTLTLDMPPPYASSEIRPAVSQKKVGIEIAISPEVKQHIEENKLYQEVGV